MSKEKSTGGGFRRGFLLGGNKPKKKKKLLTLETSVKARKMDASGAISSKTSSALLDLEDTNSTTTNASNSNRLLLVVDNGNNKNKNDERGKSKQRPKINPLFVLDSEGNDAKDEDVIHPEVGLVEVSSSAIRRKKGSLISDVFPKEAPVFAGANSATRDIPESGGGVSPELIGRPGSIQHLNNDTSNVAKDCCNNSNLSGNSTSPAHHQDTTTTTNFLTCQKDLDRTLWKLRRKRRRQDPACADGGGGDEWRQIATAFCTNLMDSQNQDDANLELLAWVWDSLLISCPKKSAQCLAEMRLGLVLLEQSTTTSRTQGWKAFSAFLLPGTEKRHRVCTLGAVTVLDFWCAQQQQHAPSKPCSSSTSPAWLIDLLKNALPPLQQQLAGHSTTRTILAQRCMTVIYTLVATSAEQTSRENTLVDSDSQKMLHQALWRISHNALARAWETQIGWMTQNDANSQPSNDNNELMERRRAASRTACTKAMLQNWRDMLRDLKSRDDTDRACEEWCRMLRGTQLQDREMYIGSIRQTLLKNDVELREEDAVACLTCALDCGKWHFSGGKQPGPEDNTHQVLLVQGVVAWLGQRKKKDMCLHREFFQLSSSLMLYSVSSSVVNLVWPILNVLWTDSNGIPADVTAWCDQVEQTRKDLPASMIYWIDLLGKYDIHNKARECTSETEERRAFLDTSRQELCRLLASCLAKSSRNTGESLPRKAIASLVEQNGMTMSTTAVLILLLKLLHQKTLPGTCDLQARDDAIEGDETRRVLSKYVTCDLLLGQFESNTVVRDLIRQEQQHDFDPFACGPFDIFVPRQTQLIAALVAANPLDDSVSILVASLSTMLRKSMTAVDDARSKAFVEQIVATLINLTDHSEHLSAKLSKTLETNREQAIERTCTLLGDYWRQLFVCDAAFECSSSNDYADVAFGTLLASIASAMFRYPASTVPLTLLGAVVGDGQSYAVDGQDPTNGKSERALKTGPQRKRTILDAVTSLVVIAVEELDKQSQPGKDSDLPGGKTPVSEAIFGQLAPLLLLRRIPPRLFQEAFTSLSQLQSSGEQDLKHALCRLGDHLAARLDINSSSCLAKDIRGFSAQERQLAAEVAGRCLPFNEQIPDECGAFSCFQRICIPSFSDIMAMMRDDDANDSDESIHADHNSAARNKIRRARAALYATCHFILFAKGCNTDFVDEALLATASFCLQCLNADQERFESPDLERDFLQLQSGCIEFFAVSVEESLSLRSVGHPGRNLVASSGGSFQKIHDTLVEIVRTGKMKHQEWFPAAQARMSSSEDFPPGEIVDGTKVSTWSVPCCTCLWNSLIVVSQRCPDEAGQLERLAETLLPWLVSWGREATQKRGDSPKAWMHHHALCVTAALQLAFILITRIKSFGGLPSTASAATAAVSSNMHGVRSGNSGSIQSLHRWALVAIQDGKGASDYAGEALRCAGLKLLLAVVTIGQTSNTARGGLIFSPKEIKETFSTLEEVAKHDPDDKMKALASHILGAVGV